MYSVLLWKDHSVSPGRTYTITQNNDGTITLTPAGKVIQQGTNMSAVNFNNMEEGILAANISTAEAFRMLKLLQNKTDALEGVILYADLKNTQQYPFNNSKTTVAFDTADIRNTKDYTLIAEVEECVGGEVGDIVFSDKMLNGFKVAYTGSATSVRLKIYVQGGR
jgi:hypothetical protein